MSIVIQDFTLLKIITPAGTQAGTQAGTPVKMQFWRLEFCECERNAVTTKTTMCYVDDHPKQIWSVVLKPNTTQLCRSICGTGD